jgi:hypothetical protein
MNKMRSHISFAELTDLADQQTTPRGEVASHLAECSTCAAELQRIENVVAVMRTDHSVDAPRDILAYAINIFRAQPRAEKPSLVQQIIAALQFDSLTAGRAFGLRSGESETRQMLYNAAEHDIDLRISEEDQDRWVIAGQVLGEGCRGGQVELEGDAASAAGLLNEQCEFRLPAVPAGNYGLRLRLPAVELRITELKIGE